MSVFSECKCDASLDFSFLMQMLSNKDANAIFMMQMSHVEMKMQGLSMMMLVRIFIPWCKYLLVEVEMQKILGCKCPLMGMSWCEWPLVGLPRCKWPLVGMQECKCPLVGMPWCECSNPNTNYSKIPFIFKMRFPHNLKPKYFQNSIYYSRKGHLFLLT